MEIKHFSGYGKVTAYKAGTTRYFDNLGREVLNVIIHVEGNHEKGLVLSGDDAITKNILYNWLLKRFFRKPKDYTDIDHISHTSYPSCNGNDCCIYTFTFLNKF